MATHRKAALLATLAGAALLAGCATDPYYDNYGHGYGGYGYNYGYESPMYYGPAYVGPSVGLGLSYYDRDYRDYRRDHDGRRGEWRGNRPDSVARPGEWRDSNGELRDSQGRTAADRDRAANSASGG
jgi:hypothetical protein